MPAPTAGDQGTNRQHRLEVMFHSTCYTGWWDEESETWTVYVAGGAEEQKELNAP